ncbi:MAG: hypothetical protein V4622_11560 [Bacteroidota bacterium]
MKTKNAMLVLALALISVSTYTKAQMVNYKVIYDDPMDMNNLFVSVDPCYFEGGDIGSKAFVGYTFQADYDMFNRLSFTANYMGSYMDLLADGTDVVTGTDNLLKKHSSQEAGLAFYFMDKQKPADIGMHLKTRGDVTTSITVPGTRRVQTGIRGGIFHYNYALETDDKDFFLGKNATTGEIDTLGNVEFEDYRTNMNVFGVYVGISRKKSHNVKVNVEGYGDRKNRKIGEFYLDFVPALTVSLKDIVYQEEDYQNGTFVLVGPKTAYDLSPTKKNLLGWRMGYQLIYPGRLGAHMKCEMGQKAGWGAQTGIYISASAGITIGNKLKFSKPKEK